MDRQSFASFSLAATFLSLGCGGNPSAGGEPGAELASGASATSPEPTSVTVRGFVHASDGTLMAGGTVCVALENADPTSCTVSDGAGSFAVQAPANSSVSLTFHKDGYMPVLREIVTGASPITLLEGENELWPVATPQTFLGTEVTPGAGHIQFSVLGSGSQPAPVVSVTLTGTGGSTGTPIYVGGAGTNAGTWGGFANVPPGVYVLRFGHAGAKCSASDLYGYPMTAYQDPSSGEASVVVLVAAGTVTAPVAAVCTP